MLPDTQLQRPGSPSFVVKQLTRWYIFLTSILKVDELAGSFPASHCTMRGGQRLLYFGLPTIAFGIKRSRVRPQMRDMTVCFLLRGTPPSQILLGQKKRGFGVGKLAGIGGRVEAGESILAAACRELKEETGVVATERDVQERGQVTFLFPHQPSWNQVVHIFIATTWTGEPVESDEMLPRWYPVQALPLHTMWDDSRYWLPAVLAGERINSTIVYAANNETVSEVQPAEEPRPSTT